MELVQARTYMRTYPLKHYRLANGLDVLLLHNPISPVVTYLTHYTVGSALERDEERGLAHFFEHMMFRETTHLKDGDFDRIMAEAGGVGLNAYTSYDTTAYYVNVPATQLPRVVELEADRMANLVLSPELIEIERGAVLGEMRMYQDMPSEQFWHATMAEAFPGHPYRHPIIGYAEQVEAFGDDDFRTFYRRHYAPNRAVVVVAGGFEEEQVLALLEAAYTGLPTGAPRPQPAPPDPPWSGDRQVAVRNEKISTEYLMLAWQTPGLQHADAPALVLLGALLSLGQASPLHRRIVHEGIGTHVSAVSLEAEMVLSAPALFLVDVSLQHGVPAERAVAAVEGLLADLQRDGIRPEDLERALNQLRLLAYSGLRTNGSMARQIGTYHVSCGDPAFGEHLLDAVERVTADDLQRVLRHYLLQAPRLTAVQRPAGGEGTCG